MTTLDVRFFVPGEPQTKGNHSGFPIDRGKCEQCKPGRPCGGRACFGGRRVGVSLTDKGGSALSAWQELIFVSAVNARNAGRHRLVERPGSVEVSMIFVLARPETHWDSRGNLTTEGRRYPMPSTKPDRDKLERTVADGLTGALVVDDSQIVTGGIVKTYARHRGKTGVVVHARQVSDIPEWARHELVFAGLAEATPPQGALI